MGHKLNRKTLFSCKHYVQLCAAEKNCMPRSQETWSFKWGEWNLGVQLSKEKGHLDTYCSSLWTCPRLHTQQIVAPGLSSAQWWPWGAERGALPLYCHATSDPGLTELHWGAKSDTALMPFVYCNMLHLTCLTCLCVYKNNSGTNESDRIVDRNRSRCSDSLIYSLLSCILLQDWGWLGK